MSRRPLFQNMLANWGGQTLVAILGLVVTPLVIGSVGIEQYGLFTLAISVTSQLILLDLGISTSLTRQVPYYRTRQPGELTELLSSGSFLLSIAALAIVVVVMAVDSAIPDLFGVRAEHRPLFRMLLWLFTADVASEVVAGLFIGVLGGLERYVLLNTWNVLRSILNACASIVIVLSGGGVVALAISILVTRVLYRMVLGIATFRAVRITPFAISRKGCQTILGFGIWVGMIHVATRVSTQIDPLVVGASLGAFAAGRYAPPLMIAEQLRLLVQLGAAPLTPRMSALFASGQTEDLGTLLLHWTGVIQVLLAALTVPIFRNGGDFLALWLTRDFHSAGIVLSLLTAAVFVSAPSRICASYLFASGRHAIYGKLLLLEAMVNVVCSLVFVRWWGGAGVAAGTLFATTLVGGGALPIITARELGCPIGSFYSRAFLFPLPFIIGYATLLGILEVAIGCTTWSTFLAVHGTGGIVYAAVLFGLRKKLVNL